MDIIKTYLDTVFKDFLDNYNLICFPPVINAHSTN